MKSCAATQPLALLLCGLLASPLCSPLSAAAATATLGQVVSAPPTTVNGVPVPDDSTLFNGDRLATGAQGWARILLPGGEQIHLAEESEAQAQRRGDRVEIKLIRGRLTLRTAGVNGVSVCSNGLTITAQEGTNAVWEVARLSTTLTSVAAHEGDIEARGANRSLQVLAGQSARLQADGEGCGDDDDKRSAILILVHYGVGTAISVPIVVSNGRQPVSPSGL